MIPCGLATGPRGLVTGLPIGLLMSAYESMESCEDIHRTFAGYSMCVVSRVSVSKREVVDHRQRSNTQ